MIISISPPYYFPNAEILHRIILSDVHVILDTTPFADNSLINKTKIITHSGISWLTVPVLSKTISDNEPVKNLQIFTGKPWENEHINIIKTAYKKSANFKKYFPFIKKILSKKWKSMADLNLEIYGFLFQELGIDTKLILASDENISGKYQNQIIKILDKTIANVYYTTPHDRIYFSEEKYVEILDEMKVQIEYQQYRTNTYTQVQKGFIPQTGTIDLLMNLGDKTKSIIMKNNKSKIKVF